MTRAVTDRPYETNPLPINLVGAGDPDGPHTAQSKKPVIARLALQAVAIPGMKTAPSLRGLSA